MSRGTAASKEPRRWRPPSRAGGPIDPSSMPTHKISEGWMGSNLTKPAAARWRASFDGRTSIIADAATASQSRRSLTPEAPTTRWRLRLTSTEGWVATDVGATTLLPWHMLMATIGPIRGNGRGDNRPSKCLEQGGRVLLIYLQQRKWNGLRRSGVSNEYSTIYMRGPLLREIDGNE